jgi:hypothetical protein
MRSRLYLFRDDTTFVHVTSRVRIGRGLQCELCLPSSRVAREHAEVVPEADGFFLSDLGSASGIFLQKQKLRGRHRVEHGDCYYLGTQAVDAQVRDTPLDTDVLRAMEDAVAEAPTARSRRQVWVDALIEHGDPLGDWLAAPPQTLPALAHGVTLGWDAGLVRTAVVSDFAGAAHVLGSRLASHLLELTIDSMHEAPEGVLARLRSARLPALRKLRFTGLATLPTSLPLAPRLTHVER